jgi:hypothetical protein
LRGPWWAAAAIGIIAVNPALIKIFSVGVSQVLISCLLVWTLYFALGEERKVSHLIISSLLAAMIWFTRINMALVLLILLAYVGWEYGRGVFIKCAVAGFGFLVLGHLLYWPGILKLWAYWLPESLTPFLNYWRLPSDILARWSPDISIGGRFNSFLQAIRFNLLPIAGLIAGITLWTKSNWNKNKFESRIMVFLAILFILLFALHAVASLGGSYCVYCFQVYLGFFDVTAIIFLILSISYWTQQTPCAINLFTVILILVFIGGVAYAASGSFGDDWLRPRVVRSLLDINIAGRTELWILFQNKFGIEYQEIVAVTRRLLLQWIPVGIGLVLGGIVLGIAWIKRRNDESRKKGFGFSAWAWSGLLIFGFLLSPTRVLGSGYASYDCAGDVIASYEIAGSILARFVRPGSLVYWTGGDSAVPLLYIPDAQIFPSQLNDGYSFRIGGDSEVIHRLSYWDETLRTQWLGQADYLLIEDRFYDDFWVNSGDWVHLAKTPPVDICREGASIQILERANH